MRRATELLAELPPGFEPPAPVLRGGAAEQGPESWAPLVNEARARAAEAAHAGILAAHVGYADPADANECRRWDVYLRTTWGWGFTATGEILMPHWDPAGNLTGCKKRDVRGQRSSFPGSKYLDLYGSWLGVRHTEVLLCEGETDAAWAGFAVAEAGLALDVFALPSGAASKPLEQVLKFLKGVKTIYLAFDPDDAGVSATRRWLTALTDSEFRDVRVCLLPRGRDLRAAQPNLRELLGRARGLLDEIPELENRGRHGFYKELPKGGHVELTNWSFEPLARLVGDEGEPGYDVEVTQSSRHWPDIVRQSDVVNITALRKWCMKRELGFEGSDRDAQLLGKWLRARAWIVPEIHQAQQVGLHPAPANYSEAGPTCALPDRNYIGAFPRRYAPGAHQADVSGRVLLPAPGRFRWEWLTDFLALSAPSVTEPLLAWLVAAARRPEVQDFPLLFLSGSSGVGKSTLARVASRLAGSRLEIDLGGTTQFVLLRTLAASTSLPVFVDEWTRMSRREAREALQGNLPALYSGGYIERGQADLTTARFKVSSPILLAGEDTFAFDRELERTITLSPTRASQNREALARITSQPIERFADGLYRWLCTPGVLETLPELGGTAPDRPTYNRGVLEAGWRTLILYLEAESAHDPDVPDLPHAPDLTALDESTDAPVENVYESLLREVEHLSDPRGYPVVWQDAHGRGVFVRPRAALAAARRAQLEIELPGGERAMMRYFAERYRVEQGLRESAYGMSQAAVSCSLIHGLQLFEVGADV